ncbi:MAG: YggS family pyridoxal phosphate-dependent enzyme [Kiritimatiellia bacterium]
MSSFSERLAETEERVANACSKAGRAREEVKVLAVAKKFGPDKVREAYDAGLRVIGENRVQEARQKIPLCPGELSWHMVGHLQANKVKPAVKLFDMIHSVDSIRLLETVNRACEQEGRNLPVCLQVNVSGESSKYGMKPEEAADALKADANLPYVEITGLMTMPPFTPDPEDAAGYFARLRDLRDETEKETGAVLPELSMGMSHDFEVAVREGATWIRLGTSLFGERNGDGNG